MNMKNLKCKNCRYFARLKHSFKHGKGFKESHCCLMGALVFGEMDVMEVTPRGMCEMFAAKEGASNV